MNSPYQEIISRLGVNRVLINEILKKYTSIKIGGPSDLFFKAGNSKDLVNALTIAEKFKVNYFVLGGGTNIVFPDKGFRGLVIKNESADICFKGLTGRRFTKSKTNSYVDKVYLEVDSGVSINRLVRNTVEQGLSGLEYFLGQPVTVGGAIWINAHNLKQGKFFGDTLVSARIYRPQKGIIEVPRGYFRFNYDRSVIQKTKDIVLTVTISLLKNNKDKLWTIAKQALDYRQKTQPSGSLTAGCLFRNIEKSQAIRLTTPNYTCSAGFLLEAVGLKGKTIGNIMFSDKHANFLINKGEAKFSDVLKLIDLARNKIRKKFSVNLELEVVLVDEI